MPISFDGIPANLRIPGSYIEFNNSLAGNSQVNFKLLFIGQRLAAGTPAATVPTQVNNANEAEAYFGRGSMLAEMIKAAKLANQFVECHAIALADDGAAVAHTKTITVTGPATAAGTASIYIGGKKIAVAIANGDANAVIATAISAAVNADDTLPFTAGAALAVVTLTARNKGEAANSIDVRVGYYGESLPAGVALAVADGTPGTTNPNIATAIAAMGDEWYNWIVMPYTDAANLTALEAELDTRWGPLVQKGARAFTAYRGNLSATTTFGNGRNSPHITCMGTNISPTPPYIWAAVNAIVAAASLSIDPARPLQTLTLPGVLPATRDLRWTDSERNTHLFDGVATHTVDSAGAVHIERQITMYQTNSNGVADDSYLDITTPETLERIRYEQRTRFALKFPRHKLAADSARVSAGQSVMQPKVARAELLSLYLEEEDKGWVQDYDGYKASLIVEINATDPNRLDIQDSPKLVSALRVHAQQIQFRR